MSDMSTAQHHMLMLIEKQMDDSGYAVVRAQELNRAYCELGFKQARKIVADLQQERNEVATENQDLRAQVRNLERALESAAKQHQEYLLACPPDMYDKLSKAQQETVKADRSAQAANQQVIFMRGALRKEQELGTLLRRQAEVLRTALVVINNSVERGDTLFATKEEENKLRSWIHNAIHAEGTQPTLMEQWVRSAADILGRNGDSIYEYSHEDGDQAGHLLDEANDYGWIQDEYGPPVMEPDGQVVRVNLVKETQDAEQHGVYEVSASINPEEGV